MGRQTNAARRRAQAETAREKAAALRAQSQRRQRRRRIQVVLGTTVGVLAVVGAIVAVGVTSSHHTKTTTNRPAAPAAVVRDVTTVPASTLTTVGKGSIATPPKPVSDKPLTSGGKPQVLFIGAEFCPYCAAERWPLVQALSRFGSFTGLKTVHSSSTDAFPNTATFSFYGAGYHSDTLSFVGREVENRTGAQLEKPTAAESALWHKYTGSAGSFPFLDIGGHYVVTGPSFDPGVLKGLTASQIAARLADPASPVAKAVDGTANVLTAAICKITDGQPGKVCSAAAVTAAAKALGG